MSKTMIPQNYTPALNLYDTQRAIGTVKRLFADTLCATLNLYRVSAPLFLEASTGLNDDLNGVERKVTFDIKDSGTEAQVVQSLAKWKRKALKDYGFRVGKGLYCDMNAIRRDEELDNLHSVYVDQWDWEKVIREEDRSEAYLKNVVRSIVSAVCATEMNLHAMFPQLQDLPLHTPNVTFITTQELEDKYPDLTPKERENAFVKENGTTFLMKIGAPLKSGKPHDGRAPDYDDWDLNGDLLFWNDPLQCSYELSSMGIRVSPESMDKQLTMAGCDDRRERTYHKMLLAGPSKAGKSFALIELCIAIAEGTPWLGRFSCAQGKVLYINLELDRASCLHRFKDVYTALGLPPQNLRNIDIWNLRGASVPMDKLAPKLIRRAGKKGYTAVILDPIYKVITGDENSADQMAKFCNQFDLVCRALDCAVIYCHHHSKGAQGGKRSMDRASGSGVFARDPDAMLDMTELTPTDAILEQLHNKAACRVLKAMLDKRSHADAYGPDDALSKSRMLAIAKEHLGMADLRAIDAQIAAAQKKADSMTAWRIEGTLREFARFDPVNLWFDYPVHKPDTGLLEDLQPDSDYKSLGTRGASKRWGNKDKVSKDKKAELDTAFEACMMDGKVTVYSMAEYMGLKPDTVRRRLKADGGFWIDGADIGRKEPGSAG